MAIITPAVRKVFKDGDVVTAEIINDIIDTLLDKDTLHANIENGTANGTLVQKGTNTNNKANYENSAAFGRGHTTSRLNQFVAGEYSAGNSKAIAIFGNGTSTNNRKNAFELLEDGRLKIQTSPIEGNDVVRLIDLDEKLAGLGTDTTSTSSAAYGSYQGAEWYRLAKVINIDHISSGIFVVEMYQCGENLLNLLSVSKFSVVCGMDEKGKFIEDVTPLAQYPREFTQEEGEEDNGGSGGSSGYKENGLVSVRIENSDDGIFVTGLLSHPLMFEDSYLLMRFSINNNLNFQVLVDGRISPTKYAKDNQVLDLTSSMDILPATPLNYNVDIYYDTYTNKMMGGGAGTQYNIKNNYDDVIFGFMKNMDNAYSWTFCNHTNSGNIYPIALRANVEYLLIQAKSYKGKLLDLFNSLYIKSISDYGEAKFIRLYAKLVIKGPCGLIINDNYTLTANSDEEKSTGPNIFDENTTISISGAGNFTLKLVHESLNPGVDSLYPILRFSFKNTFSKSSKHGFFSNTFPKGGSEGRAVKATYLYGIEANLSKSYELYSIDEKINNLDTNQLRDDDNSVFRIVTMNPPSATSIENLTFLDVINAITSKLGSLNRCLLRIIGHRTYEGIVIIGYQGGDNYHAYTLSIPSLKVCSGVVKASETKFFDFVNGNNTNTTYVKPDELKTINGESIVGSGNIVIEGGGGGSGDLSNYVTKDEGLSKDGTATLNAQSSNEFYTLVTESDIACINYSASTVPGKHTPSTYYFGNGTGVSGMKSGVIYAGNIYQNDKQVANKDDVVDLTSIQKITGSKAFTGQVGNIQSESGVYLGLDTNTAAPNANIAITSANSAAYIDMGKPNHDYDFRLIKWDSSNGNVAQMCYNTEDGGAYANITIPRASGTLALTSDIPSRVSNNAPTRSYIDYIGEENKNSQFQVAFRNNSQDNGICWSKFANMADSSMTPSECTYNGFFYVASSTNSLSGADANPFLQYHSNAQDFRILTTAYSDQWLQQIATDFRSPYIYVRRRENGSWSNWVRLLDTTGGTLYKTTYSISDPVLYVLQDGAIGSGQGSTAVANFTAYSEQPYGLQIQISPAGDTILQSRRIDNNTEKFPLQLNPEGGTVYANGKRVLTTDDIGGRLYQHILNVNVSRDTTGSAVFYCNFVIYTNFPDVLTDANAVSLLKPYFNPDNSGYGKLQLMNTVEIQSSVHKSYTVTFFLGNYPGDSNQYLYTQYRSNASGDSSLVENVLYSDGTTKLGIKIIQKDTVTPI